MTSYQSAKNQDPTLYCAYFGGPRDGFKTGDLPAALTGKKLTGMVSKTPLSQPHYFSLYAVYLCTSDTQVNGFWEFHYVGMEGPNGEQFAAAEPANAQACSGYGPDPSLRADFGAKRSRRDSRGVETCGRLGEPTQGADREFSI